MLRAALLPLLLSLASPAVAACPEWLVSDMAERGVPGFEIARMCGPAPARTIAPPVAAAPAPSAPLFGSQGGQVLGAMGGAPQAAPARGRSSRCVPEAGPPCATPSLRPLGSPCWCGGEAGPREGTIR